MPRFKMLSKALWPMGFLLLGLACGGPGVEPQVPIETPTQTPIQTPIETPTTVNSVQEINAGPISPQDERPAIITPSLPDQYQGFSDLALDSQGNYVVTWIRELENKQAVIYARRFDPDGRPVGEAFQVNEQPFSLSRARFLGDYYWRTLVAMDQDGSFCIAWNTEQGFFIKAYDALGSPLFAEQRAADKDVGSGYGPSYNPGYRENFSLAFANKKILLAWHLGATGVMYQVFSNNGEKIDSEVKTLLPSSSFRHYSFAQLSQDGTVFIFVSNSERVQKFKSGAPIEEAILAKGSVLRGRTFAINELGHVLLLEQRGHKELYAHLYDATGDVIWQDLNIHTQVESGVTNIGVQLTKNYFAVTWQDQKPKAKVMGRRFDISGQALEEAFEISSHDFEVSLYPSMDLNEAGKMVVAWHGWNPDLKTTTTLYQRRYLLSEPLPASFPLMPKPEPVCGPEDGAKISRGQLSLGPLDSYEIGYVMLELKRYSCLSEILKYYEKYEPTLIFDRITVQRIGFNLDKLSLDEAKRMLGTYPLAWDINDEHQLKTFALYRDIYNRFHGWLDDLYLVDNRLVQ